MVVTARLGHDMRLVSIVLGVDSVVVSGSSTSGSVSSSALNLGAATSITPLYLGL